ncbi:hypothetical protein CKM354_000386300 [Cercospora kikuchii]|uniref:Mob1/phocein n=1 Tax=Cercospora kikuchii TaxID=84275 RepID=A0A9P3FF73_9PEZI|nr:uncharacterized protein CKM354_000386300 [Cercospora kikuchii]GIZ40529.1 hypothetical protein CKM354_000386300 [Cercospora kikuchii]
MSSWMNNLRNLGRQANPTRSSPSQPPSRGNTSSPSANSPSSLYPPNLQQGQTPSSSGAAPANMTTNEQAQPAGRKPPFFFRDEYAGFIVKGNFMTLAANPLHVESGEWLAHQIVEQNRLLTGMVKIVQTDDRASGVGLCNEKTCPTMSAGGTTYTWIDTNRNPINLPAATYIKHIQTWVAGKIQDESVFPTTTFTQAPPVPASQQLSNDPNNWLGKSSGFPQRFEAEIKNMYKQMFRCYAHLYWSHWLQFWDLNSYRELNTCFIHFINVGRASSLLTDRDTEPMQPLIDLWLRRGDLPRLAQDGETKTAAEEAAKAPAPAAPVDQAAPAPPPAPAPAA